MRYFIVTIILFYMNVASADEFKAVSLEGDSGMFLVHEYVKDIESLNGVTKIEFCSKNQCSMEFDFIAVDEPILVERFLKKMSADQGLQIHGKGNKRFIQMPSGKRVENGNNLEVIHWTFGFSGGIINATLTMPDKPKRSKNDNKIIGEVVNKVISTIQLSKT